jgi:hypothetical protein
LSILFLPLLHAAESTGDNVVNELPGFRREVLKHPLLSLCAVCFQQCPLSYRGIELHKSKEHGRYMITTAESAFFPIQCHFKGTSTAPRADRIIPTMTLSSAEGRPSPRLAQGKVNTPWHLAVCSWHASFFVKDWSRDRVNHRRAAVAACLCAKGTGAEHHDLPSVDSVPPARRMSATRRDLSCWMGLILASQPDDRHERS